MYIFKPCKTTASYEAIPKKQIKLNLDECEEKLKDCGYDVVCNAKVMLIVKKEHEVSIYPTGMMIIKSEKEEVARREIGKISELIINFN